jgi:glycosyltransferase involved in cell wall biosynthesis
MPNVTVLMPVYNAERYLRAAIDSILTQTYSDFEFLILNDMSTDASRSIITSYRDARIRLIDNEQNLGLTRTLNKGLRVCAGNYVARHDADDIACPNRLALQIAFLEEHRDVGLLGTQAWWIDQNGRYKGVVLEKAEEHDSLRWDLLFDNGFIHTTVMFRKDIILEKLGGYDESFLFCQDYELWSRVALASRVHNLPRRLVLYRVHSHSMTERMREISRVENRRIIRHNIAELLGRELVSDEEVDLLVQYRYGTEIDAESLSRHCQLRGRLLREYQRRFPATIQRVDFKQVVARQDAKLIYKVFQVRPHLVWSVLWRNLRQSLVISVALKWLALATFARLKNI